MNIMSIDLGNKSGVYVFSDKCDDNFTIDITKHKAGGGRFSEFRVHIDNLLKKYKIDKVLYEEIAVLRFKNATYNLCGLRAILLATCFDNNVEATGFNIRTIKKTFTGNGNASKDDMINVCREFGYDPKDDNQADAIAIYKTYEETILKPYTEIK